MLGLLDCWIEGFGLWGFAAAAAAAAARHVYSHYTCHMPQRQSLSCPKASTCHVCCRQTLAPKRHSLRLLQLLLPIYKPQYIPYDTIVVSISSFIIPIYAQHVAKASLNARSQNVIYGILVEESPHLPEVL